ncbi:leucine-rich repeat domain-containing protein [Reichenbachiella ulvae]|uniref:Leucine Rich repeat-containing protein n=1 Tax=Reichenbachiella ulvae TaxID=2980104 RepID=A0ABT3CS23_9BACT|nr:hypothetical protein [Reichenbachiella ulvae]MCV9386068.1 hypothetical protein [Reichenbachiella ulvae]
MRVLLIGTLFLIFNPSWAYAGISMQEPDTSRYAEVRSLVQFYEYMLNNIGSARSNTRDKEVIITESYKKVFSSPQVQIEDDLIHNRKVITNKDVAAYLRDVDFFFKDIVFDFNDIQVEQKQEGASTYYLVTFESLIEATTLDNEPYTNAQQRFIEVNADEASGDLKIASVYHTKVSREKELEVWWESLSYGWIQVFREYVTFDSADFRVLKQISSIDSLNLSGNALILNIEPLAALRDLKYLDISHTEITDISPLRYSRNLQTLKANNSKINDVSTLEYFESLETLDLSKTPLMNLQGIEKMKSLKHLRLIDTHIRDFKPIQQFNTLESVNLSESRFNDAGFLSGHKALKEANLSKTSLADLHVFQLFSQLKTLDVSETAITDLDGLESHPSLELLNINQTDISELKALLTAPKLKKVYADYTKISQEEASSFMAKKPKTLVVTQSAQVMNWWGSLSADWKKILTQKIEVEEPGKEEIIQLLNTDSLDLSGKGLADSSPLKKFNRIKYLDVSGNSFKNFSYTSGMKDLTSLTGEGLPVQSTDGLDQNEKLEYLSIPQSEIVNIGALSFLDQLKMVNLDRSYVDESAIAKYLQSNPKTVIIYQSDRLEKWWNELSSDWKSLFDLEKVDSYHLHQLIERESMSVSGLHISSLEPLSVFINLKQLNLDQVNISNLQDLTMHTGLRELTCTKGPLESLSGISYFQQLEKLNVSSTAVSDLKDLEGLRSLVELNCSGTGISNLKGISEIYNLEKLDISSTKVWRLGRLSELRNLQTLICNNTRIIAYLIDEYKAEHPEVNVIYY